MLDALEACAAKGAARALCALAAASFQAATLLGMTCEEAASLGPRQSLQILLMKGPQAAPVSASHATANRCFHWLQHSAIGISWKCSHSVSALLKEPPRYFWQVYLTQTPQTTPMGLPF